MLLLSHSEAVQESCQSQPKLKDKRESDYTSWWQEGIKVQGGRNHWSHLGNKLSRVAFALAVCSVWNDPSQIFTWSALFSSQLKRSPHLKIAPPEKGLHWPLYPVTFSTMTLFNYFHSTYMAKLYLHWLICFSLLTVILVLICPWSISSVRSRHHCVPYQSAWHFWVALLSEGWGPIATRNGPFRDPEAERKHVIQGNGKATHVGTQRRTSSHWPRGSEQVLLVHSQTDPALTLAAISEMQVYWLSDM